MSVRGHLEQQGQGQRTKGAFSQTQVFMSVSPGTPSPGNYLSCTQFDHLSNGITVLFYFHCCKDQIKFHSQKAWPLVGVGEILSSFYSNPEKKRDCGSSLGVSLLPQQHLRKKEGGRIKEAGVTAALCLGGTKMH